jgi:NAD(P)H-hydrate repair Nnr-like enzyme with NAD(P)H-hydrate dehydratase domain
VLIVGGSHRYPGAVLLAARAAARCGAGVVTVAAARSLVEMVAGQDPNITFFPLAEAQPGVVATGAAAQVTPIFGDKIRAMLIGPGLAHASGTDDFVVALLRNAKTVGTVIDADGPQRARAHRGLGLGAAEGDVLTPHDGEAARLAGRVVPTALPASHSPRDTRSHGRPSSCSRAGHRRERRQAHLRPRRAEPDARRRRIGRCARRRGRGLRRARPRTARGGRRGGVGPRAAGALLASEIGESGALASDIVDAMPRALREILSK